MDMNNLGNSVSNLSDTPSGTNGSTPAGGPSPDSVPDNSNTSLNSGSSGSSGNGEQREEKTEEEKNRDANKRAAETLVKGGAAAVGGYLGGTAGAQLGSKIGDAVNKTQLGQAITNDAAKIMDAANKISPAGKAAQKGINKMNENGDFDKLDKGMDMALGAMNGGGKTPDAPTGAAKTGAESAGGASAPKPDTPSNAGLEDADNGTNSKDLDNAEVPGKLAKSGDGDSSDEKKKEASVFGIFGKGATIILIAAAVGLIFLFGLIIFMIVLFPFGSGISFSEDENGNSCFNFSTCRTVTEYNNGDIDNAKTYSVDDYISGIVYTYFAEAYDDKKVLEAMGIIINSDLSFYADLDYNTGHCYVTESNRYRTLNIPKGVDLEIIGDDEDDDGEIDDPSLTSDQKKDIKLFKKVRKATKNSKDQIIVDYDNQMTLNPTALKDPGLFTSEKTILRKYLNLDPNDEFDILPVCAQTYDGDPLSGDPDGYVYLDKCNKVSIYDGPYTGEYSLTEYIEGVLNKEVGQFSSNIEVMKAFAIASRTYLFTRVSKIENNTCFVKNSSAFQTFKPNSIANIKTAVRETEGMFIYKNDKLLTPEYDAFCYSRQDGTNYYLVQKNQPIPVSWVLRNVTSKSYYTNPCGTKGDGGHGRGMSQYGAYYLGKELSYNYQKILKYYYGEDISIKVAQSSSGGGKIANGILNENIGTFLSSKGSSVQQLNSSITSAVNNSGRGTRNGVVTAAKTLIDELAKYDVKLPYFWGGGHGAIVNGVDTSWGSSKPITAKGSSKQPVGDSFPNGLDCSGFVSWAIFNGGFAFTVHSSSDFDKVGSVVQLNGSAVLKPGDVLVKKGSHVALVVGIDNANKKYVTAEAFNVSKGVTFGTKSFTESGYIGLDMTSYYNSHKR